MDSPPENLKKKIHQKIGIEFLNEFSACQESHWLIVRLRTIKDIHSYLDKKFESLDLLEIINKFQELSKCCTELFKFKACKLDVYANNVLVFWKNKLTTRLSDEFTKEYFSKVKWPKVPINKIHQSSKSSAVAPFQSILEKFKLYIKILIILSSTETLNDKPLDNSKRICYPIRLMLEPIKERCIYHFIISSKTNVLDKPEWYMNLALKWIDENAKFIQDVVDPVVGEFTQYPGAYLQFVMGMIELVGMRLREDIVKVSKGLSDSDDLARCNLYNSIFIQIYTELMIFLKEIRNLIGHDNYFIFGESHDLLAMVLDEKEFADKIFDLERSGAHKLMESITTSDTCWKRLLDDEFEDQYKITECTDRFILMIQSISERLESFRLIEIQHQLVELLCDLFVTFLDELESNLPRFRPTQFVNEFLTLDRSYGIEGVQRELRHPYFSILNNVNFIRLILYERSFLTQRVLDNLDKNPSLVKAISEISSKYKNLYNNMMDRTVAIYDESECELTLFLSFIKPQVPHNIYEHIEDEARKRYQEKKTRELFSRE